MINPPNGSKMGDVYTDPKGDQPGLVDPPGLQF